MDGGADTEGKRKGRHSMDLHNWRCSKKGVYGVRILKPIETKSAECGGASYKKFYARFGRPGEFTGGF